MSRWMAILLASSMLAGQGVVVSPRITIEGQPDYSDLGRFVAFFKNKGLAGQDLAIALWQHLSGAQTGLYHFNEIFDGADTDYALGNSRDPLKNINVHNHGFCGIQGPVLEGVFRAAGFEARSFGVPAWSHVATEVFYDGQWHYFDLDLRGALLRPDGVIASAAEARTGKLLWTDPQRRVEPFFPNIRPASIGFDRFSAKPLDMQYHWSVGGWTTDHVLRPGESLTRWWHNQGGRWRHSPTYVGWMRELLEKPPRGIKPNHPDFSIWGVGSALMVYEPDLTESTRDVELGAYEIHNLRTAARGLALAEPGSGWVVFEVLSPYIIVPVMDDLDDPDNDQLNRDAATVMIDATTAVQGEVSTDGGRIWTSLGPLKNKARCDLTRLVRGRYRYLMRLSMSGEPATAVLRALELRTWGQVAPISIPRLAKGRNVLRLDVNDPAGRPTRLLPVLPHLGDPNDVKKYGLRVSGEYNPQQVTQRLAGQAVVPVEAPAGQLIEWLSVGGMFRAHRLKQARLTANKMEIASSPEGPFRTVYDATGTVPDWNQHWHYAMDVDVPLSAPARTVYVRYTGDPACNAIRIYAHCRDPRPVNVGVLRVTHDYSLGDQRILKSVEAPASGGTYIIDCPETPTNQALKVEAPHATRNAQPPPASGQPAADVVRVLKVARQAPPLPKPAGGVVRVANVTALRKAVAEARAGATILLADGRYPVDELLVTQDGLTIRGESGDRDKVILDGQEKFTKIVRIRGSKDLTIADLTVANSRQYGIFFLGDSGVQRLTIYNVKFHNCYTRGLKGTDAARVNDSGSQRHPPEVVEKIRPAGGQVRYCLFVNDDVTPNLQPYNGDYVGGIDAMWLKDWVIAGNVFVNIRGRNGGGRGAIFVWVNSQNVVAERNLIVNCDRGICFGNPSGEPLHMTGGVVRNNFIVAGRSQAIEICRTRDTAVLNNTVFSDPPAQRVVQFHQLAGAGNRFINNLVLGGLEAPPEVAAKSNLVAALKGWFVNPQIGDLRLTGEGGVGKGQWLSEVTDDFDGRPRAHPPDIGAHERSSRSPVSP